MNGMDLSRRPPVRVKCARKGCGKCLYCLKIEALCECEPEDRKGLPKNVLYGWCVKCRTKFPDDYNKVVGNQCTYCGSDIETSFMPIGILCAILLFPIGIGICCWLKERKCVACDNAVI